MHNKPISNAKIFVHSAKIFVYSGAGDGSFGILERVLNDTLTISMDGYEKQSFPVRADQWQALKLKSVVTPVKKNISGLVSITKNYLFQESNQIQAEGETYFQLVENDFQLTTQFPQTGYSLNVNKAAYSNIRRFINLGTIAPADAIRVEEMINYFNPGYHEPVKDSVFHLDAHTTECPWNPVSRLLYLNVSACKLDLERIPPGNFVFLIDVSGSMDMPNRLPMLKKAFQMFVNNLRVIDTVSIVTYGGNASVWLQPTSGSEKDKILKSIETLESAGDTPGEAGIRVAYQVARRKYIPNGNNRIILATDADFNVGQSAESALEELVIRERKSGIYLTCLGVGMGNFKDSKLQALAKSGNGNYAYLDDIREAERVLVTELTQTLYSVADDASLNLIFNPEFVKSYRLIGFDNQKDAIKDEKAELIGGEVGSGSNVLAIFEWEPTTSWLSSAQNGVLNLLAQMELKYREKKSNQLITSNQPIILKRESLSGLSQQLQFATAVTMFGLKIRRSKYNINLSWKQIKSFSKNIANVQQPLQAEFLQILDKASKIYGNKKRYWE
jgi:Ca-activated chloride channel family protein